MNSILEERLREAASLGDLKCVRTLVNKNVQLNSQNSVNGWTALHWACRRGHESIVEFLLAHGANPNISDRKGNTPKDITSSRSILKLLGCEDQSRERSNSEESAFVPNYLINAPLLSDVDSSITETNCTKPTHFSPSTTYSSNNNNLVLRIRIAGSSDPDFIEVELPQQKFSYSNLKSLCCEELRVKELLVERIRKLPNTRLRNDSDIKRLKDFDSLEIVLQQVKTQPLKNCQNEKILY